MKRVLVYLLFICAVLQGCGSSAALQEAGVPASQECDLSFVHMLSGMQEDDGSIYLSDTLYSNYIFVIDRESGIDSPLCGRPDCTHDGSDCSAFVFLPTFGFQLYGDRLYWFGIGDIEKGETEAYLFSQNKNGTGREKLYTIDRVSFYRYIGNAGAVCHKGYAFRYGVSQEIEQGKVTTTALVKGYSLFRKEEITVLEEDCGETDTFLFLQPIGDTVYIMLSKTQIGEERESANHHLKLLCWNMEERKCEILFDEDVPFRGYEFKVLDERFLISTFSDSCVYELRKDTGELRVLLQFGHEANACNGVALADTYAIGATFNGDKEQVIIVKDYEGGTVLDTVLDQHALNNCPRLLYCANDREAVFFFSSYVEVLDPDAENEYGISDELEYLVAVPFNRDAPRLLWTNESYVRERFEKAGYDLPKEYLH